MPLVIFVVCYNYPVVFPPFLLYFLLLNGYVLIRKHSFSNPSSSGQRVLLALVSWTVAPVFLHGTVILAGCISGLASTSCSNTMERKSTNSAKLYDFALLFKTLLTFPPSFCMP